MRPGHPAGRGLPRRSGGPMTPGGSRPGCGELGERLGRPALTGDARRIDALAAAAGRRPGRRRGRGPAPPWPRTAPRRCARSWPAACWCWAGSSGAARPAGNPATPCARAHELATRDGPPAAADPRSSGSCRAWPPARSGAELTATERRVADLIAAGATNRDAAAALFVSVRTVETHVASIYRKLGVRTRAELARRARSSVVLRIPRPCRPSRARRISVRAADLLRAPDP